MDVPSTDPLAAARQSLRQLLERSPGGVLVGFSGGLDSTVLLVQCHDLCRLLGRPGPVAVHVNHGVSAAADHWQGHCREACDELGIELRVQHAGLANPDAREHTLREHRYRCFKRELEPQALLLLAHNADDLLENMVLGFLRGRAPGEWSMPIGRPFGGGHLYRPLLGVGRQQLRAEAERRRLNWIEDPSNADPAMDRNLLRTQLLPMIRQRFQLDRRLPQLTRRLQDLERLAEEFAAIDVPTSSGVGSLPVGSLLALPSTGRQRNALRHWLTGRTGSVPPEGLVIELLRQLAAGGRAEVQLHGWHIRRAGQLLVAVAPGTPADGPTGGR